MLRSSINHASEIEALIRQLNDGETLNKVIDSAVLYSKIIEDCRRCIMKSNDDCRLELIQRLGSLVAKSSKLFLPYWNLFIPLIKVNESRPNPRASAKASVEFWKLAVRGSTGMLKSRTRYAARNKANSRSFTSLSETIVSCLRILWVQSLSLICTDAELALDFMRTVCKYNCLGGFVIEEEILNLLERTCWDYLETFPRTSMHIACSAAQSLKSVKGDNGLALRYISAASQETGLDLVGPFFALLDGDDDEVWLTALSLLAPHVGDEALLISYCKIIEIVLETSIKDMLLKSLWDIHLLPVVKKLYVLSNESVPCLLKSIILLVDKFDFGCSHQIIIDALRQLSTVDEKILAQVYQIVGVFASPNYSFSVPLESLTNFIVEGKPRPKLIWAAANLVSNPRSNLSSEQMEHLCRVAKDSLDSADEVEKTSAIRCDLELSLMRDRIQECVIRIEGLIDGLCSPKVLWTCANSIKKVTDKGHQIPICVIEKLVAILESASYYKVAISVTQCLSAVKRNRPSEWGDGFTERIRAALSGQRFTITDSYSEKYQQSLRSSNAELLSLLDRLAI